MIAFSRAGWMAIRRFFAARHDRQPRRAHARTRRAFAMTYMLIAVPIFVGVAAMAVDVGRLMLAKTEIQSVADAAARYAAKGLQSSSTPLVTARAHAAAVVAESKVDGGAPSVISTDVVQGTWHDNNRTFTANSSGDAVKVTVTQTFNRPGAAPLMITIASRNAAPRVTATAIARMPANTPHQIEPPASGNLWLSGMPDDTELKNGRPDAAWVWDNSGNSSNKKQRSLELNLADLQLSAGTAISLEGISGSATYDGGAANSADGRLDYIVANGSAPAYSVPSNNINGMSNVRAPIGAIMAVFLSDNSPTSGSAPSNLDFNDPTSRDYTSISPQLKQVFYVGDGKRSNGEAQSIVIPPGATRVFLGMMDAWQWNDNVGDFKTNLYTRSSIQLVK